MTIELSDVSFAYWGNDVETKIFESVSMKLENGTSTALMSPSGRGKSTLLRLIAGLVLPTSGRVVVSGRQITRENASLVRRDEIGLVFQDYRLVPFLTAEENVLLPMELRAGRAGDRARAQNLLSEVGLAGKSSQIVGSLSGGEQQRVAIARALICEPKVLLADEPTGALDSVNSDGIASLLRDLAESAQVTVVVATHDAAVAERLHTVVGIEDRALRVRR